MTDETMRMRGLSNPPKKAFEDYQFQSGVSGCPNGRRGNGNAKNSSRAPQASGPSMTAYEKKLLELFDQLIAPKDGGDPRPLIEHIMKTLAVGAAQPVRVKGSDNKDRVEIDHKAVSAALREYSKASAASQADRISAMEIALGYKMDTQREFDRCRRKRLRPPEIVPHPDHVHWSAARGLEIRGPLTRGEQEAWEVLKYWIGAAAYEMAEVKHELREDPDDDELQYRLASVTKHRRALMRKVPKGWNWREKITTCDSEPLTLARIVCRLTGVTLDKTAMTRAMQAYSYRF